MALVHEPRLARSAGLDMPRAELLEDASLAREAHEALRRRFNSLVDDVKACQ
ncbi:MAG: hypothetical protein KF895_02870 [Parvibaculum sp.]|nr:hypothetical protein [Parvibaculum sp.]